MTRNVRRITLAPAYILHHRPFRDTSRILDVVSREYGRLSVFARGVRGPKAKLVEFAGVGHAPTLIAQDQVETVTAFLLG